ncbi:MAG: 3-deoxy-manno-octulosonate cytidylyltransferase [Planctomycetes bacterium]|nr:3-deoxy-manno-octulosonate cytidylyltransferase [Planctomycetota bacterium]MCW8134207.1 3-deoxy-manno-octulosonate cytidylyltransferase [Planctomycetota bacterium]
MTVLAVIPARLASTRLPRKVLLDKTGKPLIQHVWEGAKACSAIDKVVVATDAEEVANAVRKFGGEAVLTSPQCASGTDRVAEAAAKFPDAQLVVNVQGDEPEMSPEPLSALVNGMQQSSAEMGTIAVPWPQGAPITDTGMVKVVTDKEGFALYFSRSPIPYARQGQPKYLKHVGLYAYRPTFLQQYARMAQTPLEQAESLEQLRALENGHRIAVFVSRYVGYEVNTPEDYDAFVRRQTAKR